VFRNKIQFIEMSHARNIHMDSYVTCNNKTRAYLMQLPSGRK